MSAGLQKGIETALLGEPDIVDGSLAVEFHVLIEDADLRIFCKPGDDPGNGSLDAVCADVFMSAYPNLDMEYVKRELSKVNLVRFFEVMLELLSVWFADEGEKENVQFLTDYIHDAGSWGDAESHALARVARTTEEHSGLLKGRLSYITQVLFPNAVMIRDKYPILQKAPWMLPIVWLYRPFYKLLFERKDVQRHIKGLSAVNTEDVDARRELFRMIGLGNF